MDPYLLLQLGQIPTYVEEEHSAIVLEIGIQASHKFFKTTRQ